MAGYTKMLASFLKEAPIHVPETSTFLEQLYWCYTERTPIDNEALRTQFAAVYKNMPELSEEKFDRIFTEIYKLQAKSLPFKQAYGQACNWQWSC